MGRHPLGRAVTAGKSRQQSKLQQFFRSDLAGYILSRYQSGVGIADEFGYQLALRFHIVLFVVLGYSFFYIFPAKFSIMS